MLGVLTLGMDRDTGNRPAGRDKMNRAGRMAALLLLTSALAPAGAQSFGVAKQKVTLQRKLPALVHLTGVTIHVKVTGHNELGDLPRDLQALLETELLKDDPRLREDEKSPSTIVSCQITGYSQPQSTVTSRPALAVSKSGEKNQSFTRVTGALSVSFQARTSGGQMLISDNIHAKYDEEFATSSNSASRGVKDTVTSTVTGAWSRLRGGAESEESKPPTDSELRSSLMLDAVQQIAEHIVNTDETLGVYLARGKGALDDGDKQAEGGLWQRALETLETATPMSKPEDDAYRLYNIGVAYEALAYQADDQKAAMKYLGQAAINYGKAIDAKPGEKYFIAPQKRIETAVAHYKELEEEKKPAPVAAAANAAAKPGPKALTNAQVIAMIKSGMDDDTVIQAIRGAKAIDFDLTPGGQQQLNGSGVSAPVLAAMKARAAKKSIAAGTAKSAASAIPASK